MCCKGGTAQWVPCLLNVAGMCLHGVARRLRFYGVESILSLMNRLKKALLQAIAVAAIGFIVAFAHNALSVNGINPFRKISEVPVVTESDARETAGIRFIDLDEMLAALGEGAVLLDARTRTEYEGGHIPGAILFDYYEMGRYLREVLPLLDPARKTIVYCYGPDCDDAEFLARELYTLGFAELFVFRGGYESWVHSGRAIEEGMVE
jgi:rhodanese-related sulfurtransferase